MKAIVTLALQSKVDAELANVSNGNESIAVLLETIAYDLRNSPKIMFTGRKVKRDKCGNTIGYEIKVAAYTLAFDAKGDLFDCGKM